MKAPAARKEFLAGLAAGNVSVTDLAVYFGTAGRRSEAATLKLLKPFVASSESQQFKKNVSSGLEAKRAEKSVGLAPLPTPAEINGDFKAYAEVAVAHARTPTAASEQKLKEAKARVDADLMALATELDTLEPGTKSYSRAQARYEGFLIKKAKADQASYAVAYDRAIKNPADQKAQAALDDWCSRANEGLTLADNYLQTLPAGSEAEHRLIKALEAIGANYKGIEARVQLDVYANEPFLKGTREDALLQKRFGLASAWLGIEVNQGHLEHYVRTGELTAGLKASFSRARTGDAVFGGIMTEAQLARAGHLKKKKETGAASADELKEIAELESGVKQYRGARKDLALDYADAQKAAGERLRALAPEKQTERTRAQAARYFKVAAQTYANIDDDARAELGAGGHKPGSRAARLAARATNGRADVKLSLAEAQRADEAQRYQANLANPITSLVQAYVGSVPKVSIALAKDTRSQDDIARDAMKPQPEGGRSVEAMYNEVEYLDPNLKTQPEQRRKRRELLKTRIDATEQYQAFSIASAKSAEEAEEIRDSGRLGLLEDNHELRTRSTADLDSLRAKFPPATRTSEQQGLIEAALNDQMFATESLAKERQDAQRAVAAQPMAEAAVGNAGLDLADWQRAFDAFQTARVKRYEKALLEHKAFLLISPSHPEPKAYTDEEDKVLADLQAQKKALDDKLPRTKAQQQKLATDVRQYDEAWRAATGSKEPIPSAAELYAEQMESTRRLGAEINGPELTKNKQLSGLERTEIKARHAGRTAELFARKAQAKHQDGVIKKLAAEGERELSSVERRRWKTISKQAEEIEDKAHDRAWDKLDEMGKAKDLLIARSGKEGYEQLTGEKADAGLSVRVSYTSDEENKLAQYKAQMRPHIDAEKAQEAKARALEAEGDKEQAAAATDYLQATELAEQSEALRAAYEKAERAEAASKHRDVDQDKLDQLASASVQTFARVSGSGAAIDPTASTALLKRSRSVIAAELPVLDAGSTETKSTRLSRRAFLNDFIGVTADSNRAAIAAPPRRANAWKENADAYVDLTFIGIDAGKDVVKDAPADSEQSVRADARVKKLEALVHATPALNQVSKSGLVAANTGFHQFQAYAESLKNEMTQRIRSASGGLIGRVWTIVAEDVSDNISQDTIGDSINVTEEQYDNSVDGAQHTRARYAGLSTMHDAAAKADYRTRVEYMFWLADPAADKRDHVGAAWREAGKARFVTDKALTNEKSFTQATLLWSHADPARQAWTKQHAADDLDGLAETYVRAGVGDAMYASHYQTLNDKNRLISGHLKTTVEDNFLLKAAYTGANIYTTYLVSKLAGRFLARVPGFNLLDKVFKYGTGQVARVAGVPLATGIMGGFEAYAMLTLSEHALKQAEKRWGIKPGSYEYDALNLALGGVTMSAQLNIARTNRAFYNEFRVVVGMQVGPMALANVLDLCPEDEAWLTKWTGVFLPATLGAIAARAQRRSAPQHAELISKHAGIGDEQTSRVVQDFFTNDRFLGEFDRIDSTRDVARRRKHVEKALINAGLNPDTAKHVAARDALEMAKRLVPKPTAEGISQRTRGYYDELVELMDEAGVPRDLALSVAEAEAVVMLTDAQRAAETELARQRATDALGTGSPASPAAKVDQILSGNAIADGELSLDKPTLGEGGGLKRPSGRFVDSPPPGANPPEALIVAGKRFAVRNYGTEYVYLRAKQGEVERVVAVGEVHFETGGVRGKRLVVWDPSAQRFQFVKTGPGEFMPSFHGDSAVGTSHDQMQSFLDKQAKLSESERQRLDAALATTTSPEALHLLKKELALSGDVTRVEFIVEEALAYDLSPEVLLQLAIADGFYQRYKNSCAHAVVQEALANASPYEALKLWKDIRGAYAYQRRGLHEAKATPDYRPDDPFLAPPESDSPFFAAPSTEKDDVIVGRPGKVSLRQLADVFTRDVAPVVGAHGYRPELIDGRTAFGRAMFADTLVDSLVTDGKRLPEGVPLAARMPGSNEIEHHALLATHGYFDEARNDYVFTIRDSTSGESFQRTYQQLIHPEPGDPLSFTVLGAVFRDDRGPSVRVPETDFTGDAEAANAYRRAAADPDLRLPFSTSEVARRRLTRAMLKAGPEGFSPETKAFILDAYAAKQDAARKLDMALALVERYGNVGKIPAAERAYFDSTLVPPIDLPHNGFDGWSRYQFERAWAEGAEDRYKGVWQLLAELSRSSRRSDRQIAEAGLLMISASPSRGPDIELVMRSERTWNDKIDGPPTARLFVLRRWGLTEVEAKRWMAVEEEAGRDLPQHPATQHTPEPPLPIPDTIQMGGDDASRPAPNYTYVMYALDPVNWPKVTSEEEQRAAKLLLAMTRAEFDAFLQQLPQDGAYEQNLTLLLADFSSRPPSSQINGEATLALLRIVVARLRQPPDRVNLVSFIEDRAEWLREVNEHDIGRRMQILDEIEQMLGLGGGRGIRSHYERWKRERDPARQEVDSELTRPDVVRVTQIVRQRKDFKQALFSTVDDLGISDPQSWLTVNDPELAQKFVEAVKAKLKSEPRKLQLFAQALAVHGISAKEMTPAHYKYYADEIIDALLRVTSKDILDAADVKPLVRELRHTGGIRLRYTTRVESDLKLGEKTGDCTSIGSVNFENSVSWMLNPGYQVMTIAKNGRFLGKIQVAIATVDGKPAFVIDALEVNPQAQPGRPYEADARQGINEAIAFMKALARKNGRELYALTRSNSMGVNDMLADAGTRLPKSQINVKVAIFQAEMRRALGDRHRPFSKPLRLFYQMLDDAPQAMPRLRTNAPPPSQDSRLPAFEAQVINPAQAGDPELGALLKRAIDSEQPAARDEAYLAAAKRLLSDPSAVEQIRQIYPMPAGASISPAFVVIRLKQMYSATAVDTTRLHRAALLDGESFVKIPTEDGPLPNDPEQVKSST